MRSDITRFDVRNIIYIFPLTHVTARDNSKMAQSSELSEAVVTICRTVQRFLASYEEGREADKLDSLVYHVERLYRILLIADNCGSDVLEAVGKSLTLLQDIHVDTQCGYVTSVLQEKRRGHPRLDVGQGLLKYLLHLEFSCLQIADVLGVSLSTIRRRMNEFGFSVTTLYSNITDQELDSLVSQIKEEFPNCGSRLMHGHLLSRGHRITQA